MYHLLKPGLQSPAKSSSDLTYKNGNPCSIWAYFPENHIFTTGWFQGVFDPVSPLIFKIGQNRGLTVLRGEKQAFLTIWTGGSVFGLLADRENGK
jgi:hypothetical protein